MIQQHEPGWRLPETVFVRGGTPGPGPVAPVTLALPGAK
jgi:hypothetical protein